MTTGQAMAEEPLHLTLRNHQFIPERLEAPSGVKFKLLVKNEDDTPAEFESFELQREKVVPAGHEVPIFIGPLEKGDYPILDDFHQETKGVISVK